MGIGLTKLYNAVAEVRHRESWQTLHAASRRRRRGGGPTAGRLEPPRRGRNVQRLGALNQGISDGSPLRPFPRDGGASL
ncbi:MAG: hypothetical protein WKG07_08885, partial [Hymenobacter sp.]